MQQYQVSLKAVIDFVNNPWKKFRATFRDDNYQGWIREKLCGQRPQV
jgi:hypothetical protein